MGVSPNLRIAWGSGGDLVMVFSKRRTVAFAAVSSPNVAWHGYGYW